MKTKEGSWKAPARWLDSLIPAHIGMERGVSVSTVLILIAWFVIAVGVICLAHWVPSLGSAISWAMASLIAGTLIGFLFGIPKVLQANSPASTNNSSAQETGYRQQVNTNLTEISDW